MRSNKNNIQNFIVIKQLYAHCITGISQQPCETGWALVFILKMRKIKPQRLRVGQGDRTELGLDSMSPYSQPTTLFMRPYGLQICLYHMTLGAA